MALDDIHRRAGERGFVTRDDVRDAEVHQSTFSRHARQIGWEQRHRGLWTPPSVLTHAQEVHAAVEAIGGDLMVTGASGLLLDGILEQRPARVELLLASDRHLRKREGICFHRTLAFKKVRSHHRGDVAVVAVARAFADYAEHAGLNDLCRDIATGVRKRQVTLSRIEREIVARRRFPGRGQLRTAHGLLTGELTHSAGEQLGRRLLRPLDVQPHPSPMTVEIRGRPAAEIDIPFPELLYGVEIDGPQHLLPNVAAADRARDRQLDRVHWKIDRFFWFELEERPQWFVAEVTRRLAERANR